MSPEYGEACIWGDGKCVVYSHVTVRTQATVSGRTSCCITARSGFCRQSARMGATQDSAEPSICPSRYRAVRLTRDSGCDMNTGVAGKERQRLMTLGWPTGDVPGFGDLVSANGQPGAPNPTHYEPTRKVVECAVNAVGRAPVSSYRNREIG